MSEGRVVTLLPAGGQFTCSPGQTLLDGALAAGYWLPHSCRGGTCGTCAVAVEPGAMERLRPDADGAPVLPPGQYLACQCSPVGDVEVLAPMLGREPGQRIVTTGARVADVQRPTSDVAVVRLQIPPEAGFRFRPGQYLDILLRDGSRRSYSMANEPDGDGSVELHVRRLEGGRFSAHAYDRLKARDLLRVEGPFGAFMLREGDAPIVLLASGTGYAPISAMLRTHADEFRRRGATVYWGGRTMRDLYAHDDIGQWSERFPGIGFVPVLSEADGDWAGRTGFVHQAVLADVADLSGHEVYACGNPLMIDAARKDFTTTGRLQAGNFFSDAFVQR